MAQVRTFDGLSIPEANASYDVVQLAFVLHHAARRAPALLREVARVSRQWVLVAEDLDLPGDPIARHRNWRHDKRGVYRSHDEWLSMFADAGLQAVATGPMYDFRGMQNYYILRRAELPRRCRASTREQPDECNSPNPSKPYAGGRDGAMAELDELVREISRKRAVRALGV